MIFALFKKTLFPFLLFFILNSCSNQKIEITEQDLFEDFLTSEKLKNHFRDKNEIYILRDKKLCKKIDCDKSYLIDGKKVNIWERANYFSRAMRDYAIINNFDKKNNNVNFYLHK